MIVIRVKMQIKPDVKTDFVTAMTESIAISSKFAGCLNFGLYSDVVNDNTFILYEEWETQAEFDAYKASEHFEESGKVLFPLMDGKPDSAYFQADLIE